MKPYHFFIGLFLLILTLDNSTAARNQDIYCGICRAIMSEVEHSVAQVDPNKKIDVGSYRIDPNGKTRTAQKSYARSDSHLTELLENVCEEVSENYVKTKDPDTGKPTVKRMVTHDGKMSSDVDFSQLMEDSKSEETPPDEKTKSIKFTCESIVEDYEDDIMHFFKNSHTDFSAVCADIAEYCPKTDKDEL